MPCLSLRKSQLRHGFTRTYINAFIYRFLVHSSHHTTTNSYSTPTTNQTKHNSTCLTWVRPSLAVSYTVLTAWTGRQSFGDKAGAALKPDSEKTYLEQGK